MVRSRDRKRRTSDEKVNSVIDEILDEEDSQERCSEDCTEACAKSDDSPNEGPIRCKCAIENSLRFSLRVLEAMRSLQRDEEHPATSSVDEIVDYIKSNYRNDGDLHSQVTTSLRQLRSQGLVLEFFENEYHLIGPIASLMSNSNRRDNFVSSRISHGPGERVQSMRSVSDKSFSRERCSQKRKLRTSTPRRRSACNCTAEFDRSRSRNNQSKFRERERSLNSSTALNDERNKNTRTNEEDLSEELLENRNSCVCNDRMNGNQEYRRIKETRNVQNEETPNKRIKSDIKGNGESESDDSVYRELYAQNYTSKFGRSKTRDRELKEWIRRCRRECERRRTGQV